MRCLLFLALVASACAGRATAVETGADDDGAGDSVPTTTDEEDAADDGVVNGGRGGNALDAQEEDGLRGTAADGPDGPDAAPGAPTRELDAALAQDAGDYPTDAVVTRPSDLVPIFVATGNGGRTVTSCDDGLSWIANHQYENSNADHSEYTQKGSAYGNGFFVSLMGWGAWSTLKVSDDGVSWRRVSPFQRITYGAIAHDGKAFVVFDGYQSMYATDPTGTWARGGRTGHETHLRGGGGGPAGDGNRGAVAGGGENRAPVMSWNGGLTWTRATGCPSMNFANLGQAGGAAFGDGALVVVGDDGASCRISNFGSTRQPGRTGGPVWKVSWVGDRFFAADDRQGYTSTDGVAWTARAYVPDTVRLRAVARSERGTYVGIGPGGGAFFRSADGVSWTRIAGPSGPVLNDLHFGWAKPSASCPGR